MGCNGDTQQLLPHQLPHLVWSLVYKAGLGNERSAGDQAWLQAQKARCLPLLVCNPEVTHRPPVSTGNLPQFPASPYA